MKRIGFYGGTFDPIHFGHINLALGLLEAHNLDEILFSPAFVSPHKIQTPPLASAADRMQMIELAIDPIPQFSLYPHEIERGGTSFTIDTIKDLKNKAVQREEEVEFFLILGTGTLDGLHQWKDVEDLFMLVQPLIGCSEEEFALAASKLPPVLIKTLEKGKTQLSLLNISSTQLRARLKKRLYCGHLMPREVLDFIIDNELYLK